MTNLVGRTLYRLGERLPGRVSTPGEDGYAAATAIWSKPVGRTPPAVVHCRTVDDAALAVRAPICPFSQYLPDPAGFPDALPKNRTGKLHRRALRESLAGSRSFAGLRAGCSSRVTLEHAQLAALRSREACTAIGRAAA